jgi:hypothetical protein
MVIAKGGCDRFVAYGIPARRHPRREGEMKWAPPVKLCA